MILAHCQTYAFTVLGLSQLFHAIGMRDVEKSVFRMDPVNNRLMILALAVGFSLQFVVTEQTSLVAAFQTVRLTKTEWARLLILSPCRCLRMSFYSCCRILGEERAGRRSIGESPVMETEHCRGTEAG